MKIINKQKSFGKRVLKFLFGLFKILLGIFCLLITMGAIRQEEIWGYVVGIVAAIFALILFGFDPDKDHFTTWIFWD